MSTFQKITFILKLDPEGARNYCTEIQKQCKGFVPSYKTILGCMEQHPERVHDPRSIADVIIEENPKLVQSREKGGSRGRGVRYKGEAIDQYTAASPIMAHDPRKYTEGMKKCPHGIPLVQLCAICDPEKFKLMHGSDW